MTDKECTEVQKEQSKLECIESSLKETETIITILFTKVNNIEEKLGENNSDCSKDEAKDQVDSRFGIINGNIKRNNSDLSNINIRLQKILDLF